MEKILTKKAFPQWIKKLESYKLYTPRKDEDIWNFEVTKDSENIELDYQNSVVSPKKIIFPQSEILLEFSSSGNNNLEIKEILPDNEAVVIFGLRPCDGRSLALIDKVFSGDFQDPYYWKRRNKTSLIGLSCLQPPSPNCFCLSVDGSPHSVEGLDILLTDLGDKFYVESLTEKGDKLLGKAKELFQEPKPEDKKAVKKIHLESEEKIKRRIKDIKSIPSKLKEMFDSPFWDEESLSCIRCGICTYLCPTCHCFDINDEVTSSSPLKGKRVRTWDTCQFPDFTMHSSGHNPRPDKASRLRQRMFHKFKYFVELYQNFQCIGCGRCISYCPVRIDIINVLDKVKDHGS